jgi:hypothetical protein
MIKHHSEWLKGNSNRKEFSATEFLNSLDWNLLKRTEGSEFQLWAGDKLLAASDRQEEIDAFELGMATAWGVLPDEILDMIRKVGSA